jgi:hypothetical protein
LFGNKGKVKVSRLLHAILDHWGTTLKIKSGGEKKQYDPKKLTV